MGRGSQKIKAKPTQPSQPTAEEVNQLLDCFSRQDDAAGVAQAKALLARFPSFGFGWKVLGAILNRMGRPEDALSAMERAAALMPDDTETHSNLGVMYKALNRNPEAEACYRRALGMSPQAANAHNNLGNLLCEQGKLQAAEQHLRRALELRSAYPDALLNLGNTLFEQGRYSEAEQFYRQCLALLPEHVKACYGLGLAVSKQGRHHEAEPWYRKVLASAPDNFGAYNNLGVALQSMGKIEDAKRCFDQAIRINPAFVDAYNNLAIAMLNCLDSGDPKGVVAYLEDVLKNAAPQTSWRFATLLLIAHQIAGEHSKAAEVCRQFKNAVERTGEKTSDKDQQSLKSYFNYLTDLLLIREKNPALYQSPPSAALVEVLGESHCLCPAHTEFPWHGQMCRAVPRFVMGIKMHHLAQPGVHRMKILLNQHLARLAPASHLLFTIGEIDCRPKEGIWTAAQKGKGTLPELIRNTVDGYLVWLKQTLADKPWASITLQGIPAPGRSLEGVLPPDQHAAFLAMIREVNARLKQGVLECGWAFLDVYAATVAAKGYGNGQWHLDGIHLSPGFYQAAQDWCVYPEAMPAIAEKWKNRGNTFYVQGRLDEAMVCYRQAISNDPGYAPPYNNLGSICFVRGQNDDAIACFRQALALQNPLSSGTVYSLGLALHAAGNSDEAMHCFEQALSLAADNWTADAQACLAVIYFLQNRIEQLTPLLRNIKPVQSGANQLQSYLGYLKDLLDWRERNPPLISFPSPQGVLHIVGESHALSWHGLNVSFVGAEYRCQGTWILGCKQWHLAKPGENQYKFQVRRLLKSLPPGAAVVLAFGEIDCRPNEGIWLAFKEGKGALGTLIAQTVDAYLSWLGIELAGKEIASLTVQGVPAPAYPLGDLREDVAVFLGMIHAFNECLRNGVLARGWGFLDVYAATASANGESNRHWHLDGMHLSPGFYQVAERWRLEHARHADLPSRVTAIQSQIERFGRLPVLLQQLAEAFIHLGRYREALPLLEEATPAKLDDPNLWNQMGVVLRQLQRFNEAHEAYLKALALCPGHVELMLNVAINLQSAQQAENALTWLIKARQQAPDDPRIRQAMAAVLIDLGRYQEAEVLLRELLAAGHRSVPILSNSANLFVATSRSREALPLLEEALQQSPDFFDSALLLGSVYYGLGELEQAETQFQRAARLNPMHIVPLINQMEIQLARGDFAQAKALCTRALTLDANHPEAWAALAGLQKNSPADWPWLEKAEQLLQQKMPVRHETCLRYAVGKFCDDLMEYDRAFFHYQQANELKRRQFKPYSADEQVRYVDLLIEHYSLEACRLHSPGASLSARPLFIVGMPRSGTSLTEQILASHPAVLGAGELLFWAEAVRSHQAAALTAKLSAPLLQETAAACLENLNRHSRDALRVVDKMPGNFLHLGFIHAAFPNARILHTLRNPVDTCLSNYFQNFSGAQDHAQDLDDLAHYYRQYHRLMAHWRSVLPKEVFLDVPYEQLIEDQEGWSRKIIEFIGLEWDERCLEFYKTERKVGTASNWQARQPIYKSSKERWRNYEKHIGPLLPLLELYDPARGQL